jgi:type II secretory pathway pseudopilin PulG
MKYVKTNRLNNSESGFTIVELLVIVLIIGVLLAVLLLTYSGVRVRERNTARVTDIKQIQSSLESFYAQDGFYPTLSDLNSPKWTAANLKTLDPSTLQDPSAKSGAVRFSDGTTTSQFTYHVTASDGSTACDDKATACAQYTLTAYLEGSAGEFTEKSLNN